MRSRLETLYVGVALTYFVLGVALGIGMGITQDFSYMHLHAHINLVGFVAHGVFGITHRLWPALRDSLLAPFQFSLMLIGTPIFLFGLPLAQYHSQPIFAIIGSLMVLAAAAVFLAMFAGRTWRAVQV
jgi:hypothetical protein